MTGSSFLRVLTALACTVAAAASGVASAAEQASDRTTLFEGARLIPGDGTDSIENSAFVVRGDRVVQVGKRGEVKAPAGARRVDLAGKTVMPMMMTLHTHPGVLIGTLMSEKNFSRESVLDALERFAYYGFAAVGSMGVDPGEVAYQIRGEKHPGHAMLRTAGRGFGWPNQATGVQAINRIPYGVTTPAEGVKFMRELAAKKPDFVKIWVDDRGGRHRKLTPDLYRPIIEEAHKHRIPVLAHMYYLKDAHDLVDAGVQGFVHLTRDREVDDALVKKMLANGVFVTPNIYVHSRELYQKARPEWLTDPELAATLPKSVIDEIAKLWFTRNGKLLPPGGPNDPMPKPAAGSTFEHLKRSVAKLNRAGVPISVGCDTGPSGTVYGFGEHLGMETFVDAGLTPMQAIVAATARPARLMGLYEHGSLQEGKVASFVVLNANPLENIRNTRRIADVYQDGVRLDRAAMSKRLLERAPRLIAKQTGE